MYISRVKLKYKRKKATTHEASQVLAARLPSTAKEKLKMFTQENPVFYGRIVFCWKELTGSDRTWAGQSFFFFAEFNLPSLGTGASKEMSCAYRELYSLLQNGIWQITRA